MENQTMGQQVLLNEIQQYSLAVNECDNEIDRKTKLLKQRGLLCDRYACREIDSIKFRRDIFNRRLKEARQRYIDMIHAQVVGGYLCRKTYIALIAFSVVSSVVFWYFIIYSLLK